MQNPIKILVVEDDFQNRQLINIYLSRSDFEVTLMPNGFAALEILKTYRPDLIISDISMPHMDGFELYKEVKAIPELRSVPFIFLTAHSDSEKRRYGKEIGSDDFLTKPIEPEDLLASIRGKLKRVDEIRSSTETQMFSQIDKLKREILSTITHEVNTPLFIIKLTANLLLDESMEFKPNELHELLQRIKKSGDRLDTLLKDFLITVRIAAGDARNEHREAVQEGDLNFIIQQMTFAFEKRAKAKQLKLTVDLDRNIKPMKIHVDQIVDVIERLFSNAVKFSKPEGEITILTKLGSDYVRLMFKDTGIGIPKEQLGHIFRKFYQVNRAEMEQQGAGLGLAIAKDLAAINGAEIHVESREGIGSEFSLVFPLTNS